jgi:hypothetical protein
LTISSLRGAKMRELFEQPKNTRRCAHCGAEAPIGEVAPFGVGPYTWLHFGCWESWISAQKAEAA